MTGPRVVMFDDPDDPGVAALDEIVRSAVFSADVVAMEPHPTGAARTRAIVRRAFEFAFGNGLIEFTGRDTWPAWRVLDPPYPKGSTEKKEAGRRMNENENETNEAMRVESEGPMGLYRIRIQTLTAPDGRPVYEWTACRLEPVGEEFAGPGGEVPLLETDVYRGIRATLRRAMREARFVALVRGWRVETPIVEGLFEDDPDAEVGGEG